MRISASTRLCLLALPLALLIGCGDEEPTALEKVEQGLDKIEEGQEQLNDAVEGVKEVYTREKERLDEVRADLEKAKAGVLEAQRTRLAVMRSTIDALGRRVATLPAGEEADARTALTALNTKAEAFEQQLAAFASATGEGMEEGREELDEAAAELQQALDAMAERIAAARVDPAL